MDTTTTTATTIDSYTTYLMELGVITVDDLATCVEVVEIIRQASKD
jgi:hypothetical protein